MKYPADQFSVLVKALKLINKYVSVDNFHLHSLHFIVFQQFSAGHTHNKLILTPEGVLTKNNKIVDNQLVEVEGTPLIDFKAEFELYPEGCNDNHVETAMKRAVKEVLAV